MIELVNFDGLGPLIPYWHKAMEHLGGPGSGARYASLSDATHIVSRDGVDPFSIERYLGLLFSEALGTSPECNCGECAECLAYASIEMLGEMAADCYVFGDGNVSAARLGVAAGLAVVDMYSQAWAGAWWDFFDACRKSARGRAG